MTERGDRVKLIHVNDPHTKLAPGTLGTVTSVDSLGTVHVKWDDGHHLGLVAEAGDAYRVIGNGPPPRGQVPPSERIVVDDVTRELLS